jgi:hypothetical protein
MHAQEPNVDGLNLNFRQLSGCGGLLLERHPFAVAQDFVSREAELLG